MPVSSATSRTAACSARLAGLDVPLGQRPEQPSLPVGAADQRAARHVAAEVDDQATGAELVDPPHPAPPAVAGASGRAGGHGAMVTGGSFVSRYSGPS